MKQRWFKLRDALDARNLRERIFIFAALTGLIVFALYAAVLEPLFARQTVLRNQVKQQNNNLTGIDAEITAFIKAYQTDPDQAAKTRLSSVQATTAQLLVELDQMQSDLVQPDSMTTLIQNVINSNQRLRLISMSNLPPVAMKEEVELGPAIAQAATGGMATSIIYRHGVELQLSGNYLDMVDYMRALEALPTRVYWGRANLQVTRHPNATLSLTLYTLSLDRKWMTL